MPATKNERAAMRERYPNAWIGVTEGDVLEGDVIEVTRAWSDQRARGAGGGWYPLLQVRTDDGPILSWHAFETVAYNRVMEIQPLPGERIIVTFRGEGKAKPGMNAPKLYSITLPTRDPKDTARAVYGRLAPDQPRGNSDNDESEVHGF